MDKIKNYFTDWTMFEKLWLITVCTIMTVIWYLNGDAPFLLALTLTGSLNLVLGAKGKIAGLYFAIINCLLCKFKLYFAFFVLCKYIRLLCCFCVFG